MRKKVLACLLAACLGLGVCACGSDGNDTKNSDTSVTAGGNSIESSTAGQEESGAGNDEAEGGIEQDVSSSPEEAEQDSADNAGNLSSYERNEDGIVVLNEEQIDSFIEIVELTPENLGDYLGTYEVIDYTPEEKNQFGEVVTPAREEKFFCFGSLNGCLVGTKDFGIRFSNRKTKPHGEEAEWEEDPAAGHGEEYYQLENLLIKGLDYTHDYIYDGGDCVQVVGSVAILMIPDELWTEKDGQEVIILGSYLVQKSWHRLYSYDQDSVDRFVVSVAGGDIPIPERIFEYLHY